MKKVNYSGSSKVIIRLCQAVNDLIDRGGGGHTIQNSSGTDMTARTNLQFTGATVSDDAVNDRTVVAISSPTVNDGTLTIQKNGTAVATFTANQSTASTANITVPTALSDLSDDTTHRVVTDTQISGWDGKQDDVGLSIVNGVICQTYMV